MYDRIGNSGLQWPLLICKRGLLSGKGKRGSDISPGGERWFSGSVCSSVTT